MNNTSLIRELSPRYYHRFASLPVLGGQVEPFLRWLGRRGYKRSSRRHHLYAMWHLSRWLARRGIVTLAALDQETLTQARDHFRTRKPHAGGAVSALKLFLRQGHKIHEGRCDGPTASEVELERFGKYLRRDRGLAAGTILAHRCRLRPFLKFLNYDRRPRALAQFTAGKIEAFLKHASRTNNRFSLQHVVATLRSFLKYKHAQRIIARPLHQQIDTPRVYKMERLPRALRWEQVQQLLTSVDLSNLSGRRDFALLYLTAAYGLRSSEVVRLTLDDIDWRGATIRVPKSKTGRDLQLPLTNEAAKVLIDYLRDGRPASTDRRLFLRTYAPPGPLEPTAVNDILDKWAKESGLKVVRLGSHVLRHSFAIHLLRRNVSVKSIGDVLGHRHAESTAVYLRLALEDLREVGLPVPRGGKTVQLAKATGCSARNSKSDRPRPRAARNFSSGLAASLRGYLELKRALGCRFSIETATLLNWDRFVRRHFGRARAVCPRMFNDWAAGLDRLTPTVRRNRLRIVRNFLLFHARRHPNTFIPDPLTFPKSTPPRLPRLVTGREMAGLLRAAEELGPSQFNPLRAQTCRLAFVLLFCCGLRRGELLRLTIGDFDPAERVLRITGTKFHKSRLVPLPGSVFAMVREHLKQRRGKGLPTTPDTALVWCGRRGDGAAGYTATGLTDVWQQLCRGSGVLDDRGRPPRLHDLRHSFAVAALQRWYARFVDVQAKLPHLAAYLGHVSPVSTHYYLRLTPELSAAASARFDKCAGHLLGKGGAL
jgi:site-specific recombinase XerD